MKYSGDNVITKIFQLIKSEFDKLSTVANTGDYGDLINTPLINREDIEVIEGGTSTINIPSTMTSTISLFVYLNGLLIVPNKHYTISNDILTLNDYTTKSGDIFTFIGVTASSIIRDTGMI